MKNYIFITLFLSALSASAQDITYTQSQLDSLDNKTDTKEFQIIENVPIYKGCEREKGNANKKKCMSGKIAQLFKRNFNTTLPKNSTLQPGLTSIFVSFKVGKDGKVIDVVAKAKDSLLINEATRVAKLMPDLTPGHFRGKPVIVPYALPLKVNLESTEEEGETTYPIYRGCDKDMSNEELKKCSVRKIKNFIKLSFDTGIADVALPQEKSTQFQLDFIINKKGKVEQVNAKANHRAIAIEAIRTAKRLPKFKKPGTKNKKAVDTPFSLLMTIYF